MTRGALSSILLSVSLWWAASAQAQALVQVELRGPEGKPAEGQVSLRDADGKVVASCTTKQGRCEMAGVPGGSYRATVKPARGKPPKPKSVMIPPSGKVSLIIGTGGE